MRPIHLAALDKRRPAVVLTREVARARLTTVTVAPITSVVRGVSTEVPVGPENGLDEASVISCDNVTTIGREALGPQIGVLFEHQEELLGEAIQTAFDLA